MLIISRTGQPSAVAAMPLSVIPVDLTKQNGKKRKLTKLIQENHVLNSIFELL